MTDARVPGTWWFWYYKDALKTGAKIPDFSLPSRRVLEFVGLANILRDGLAEQI